MQIVSLKAANIMRLKAVEINPDGSMVVIGGRNAQGKSSVLNAITLALGGAAGFCERPLRDGAERGEIVVDLGDLVVRRTFSADGGTKLVVKGKDGNTKTSPQTLLDDLTGRLSFDPLSFSRMDAKKQLETLKSLVGLDFSEVDARRKTLFDDRTNCGRDGQAVKARLDAMPHHPDVPATEISVVELSERIEAARANNRKRAEATQTADKAAARAITLRADADGLTSGAVVTNEIQNAEKAVSDNFTATASYDAEIARLEHSLSLHKVKRDELLAARPALVAAKAQVRDAAITAANAAALAAAKEHREAADLAASLTDIPVQPIIDQATNAETTNRKVRQNQNHRDQLVMVEAARKKWDELTAAIKVIDEDKEKQVAQAEFPVPGLSFNDTGVLFNKVPFSQASSAEQLKVSVAMGLKLNPTLRVVLIRDGSLLDEDSLRMVAELAAANDAQVWVEKVTKDQGECAVIIEDGMVAEAVAAEGAA